MTLKNQIERARGDAAGLERLYRQALAAGDEPAFREAITQCAEEHPEDLLFLAWAYRLDVRSPPDVTEPEGRIVTQSQTRRWWTAVAASVILGILYVFFAGGKPPVPIPGEANPLFWIGWAPLTAMGILFYLTVADRAGERIRWHGGPAIAIVPIAVYTALIAWNRTDPLAILIALHLPFVAWAAVGVGSVLGRPDPVRQGYAFLVKSLETVLTGGIYFGAGVLFLGLTHGIFAALGIKLSQAFLRTAAAWGIGVIPILALANIYDPTAAPVAQSWDTGLARVLRILTRLILPLALGVLAVYIFWFIPAYFWRPFQEREVLVVYNATIMAILVLLTAVVAGPDEQRSPRQDAILRYAVLLLGMLTLLLNVYALTVIVSRTFAFGLTPNRYAVLGWNVVTLLILAAVVIPLWKARSEQWVPALRESIARVSVLAVAWALWVLLGLPLSFI